MNLPLQTIALVEMALACSAAAIWILQKFFQREFSFITKAILLLAMANLLFWPLGMSLDLPLAAYVRGVVGDLSIVTLLLLLSSLFLNQRQAPAGFKLGIVVVGFAFYPFALGFTMFDPYAWGYGSIAFLIAVLLCAIVCVLASSIREAWIIAFAIIAWGISWHESANLWDYLLDPLLLAWAMLTLIARVMRKRKEKSRSGYLFRPG